MSGAINQMFDVPEETFGEMVTQLVAGIGEDRFFHVEQELWPQVHNYMRGLGYEPGEADVFGCERSDNIAYLMSDVGFVRDDFTRGVAAAAAVQRIINQMIAPIDRRPPLWMIYETARGFDDQVSAERLALTAEDYCLIGNAIIEALRAYYNGEVPL